MNGLKCCQIPSQKCILELNQKPHLECNSEVFQYILIEVILVKEQQELKHTPVREQKSYKLLFDQEIDS